MVIRDLRTGQTAATRGRDGVSANVQPVARRDLVAAVNATGYGLTCGVCAEVCERCAQSCDRFGDDLNLRNRS